MPSSVSRLINFPLQWCKNFTFIFLFKNVLIFLMLGPNAGPHTFQPGVVYLSYTLSSASFLSIAKVIYILFFMEQLE